MGLIATRLRLGHSEWEMPSYAFDLGGACRGIPSAVGPVMSPRSSVLRRDFPRKLAYRGATLALAIVRQPLAEYSISAKKFRPAALARR